MTYGAIQVLNADIDTIKSIFQDEGFHEPGVFGILQKKKEGQKFGLIKPINEDLEIHVRGYEDLTIDSEIELRRKFIEHLKSQAYPYYDPIIQILQKHNLHFEYAKSLPVDPQTVCVPDTRIEWRPIAEEMLGLLIKNLEIKNHKQEAKKLIEIISRGL